MPARVLPAWVDACFPNERDLDAQRPLACRHCQRGWMLRVEDDARATVEPMLLGTPVVLAQQNQERLARWCVKTVLALQAIRDPNLLGTDVYRQFAAHGLPPQGFRVSVGIRPREGHWPYRFSSLGSATERQVWDIEPTYSGAATDHYRAEFCAGHLVIRVAAHFAPHAGEAEPAATIDVWPLRSPVRWPPTSGLMRNPALIRRAA